MTSSLVLLATLTEFGFVKSTLQLRRRIEACAESKAPKHRSVR
jgi:hypothetical protein